MFPNGFWPKSFFPPGYWPKTGSNQGPPPPPPGPPPGLTITIQIRGASSPNFSLTGDPVDGVLLTGDSSTDVDTTGTITGG